MFSLSTLFYRLSRRFCCQLPPTRTLLCKRNRNLFHGRVLQCIVILHFISTIGTSHPSQTLQMITSYRYTFRHTPQVIILITRRRVYKSQLTYSIIIHLFESRDILAYFFIPIFNFRHNHIPVPLIYFQVRAISFKLMNKNNKWHFTNNPMTDRYRIQ